MGQLSGNAMNVNGTGQSVGDLKNAGYSQGDIQSLGTSPNIFQRIAKAGLQGVGQGLQNQQSQNNVQRQVGGPGPNVAPFMQQPDPSGLIPPGSPPARNSYFFGYGQ